MTPIRVNLEKLRKAKGWSQQRLGDEAGVRQATISELESGKRQRADFAVLDRLAAALGCGIGELLERESSRKRKR